MHLHMKKYLYSLLLWNPKFITELPIETYLFSYRCET